MPANDNGISSVAGSVRPTRAVVVGAGIVGLSCAWALQEHGVDVCVVDRHAPGAGSSWQNAGYVSPSMCAPLPEPSILRYGVSAVLRPSSPVSLQSKTDLRLLRFMAEMVRHCTAARWRASMATYRQLNAGVFEAYDRQVGGGVDAVVTTSDVLACFAHAGESVGLLHELDGVVASGQSLQADLLTGDQVRQLEPHVSGRVQVAVRVRGQRYLTPSTYVGALAASVRRRGGAIHEDTEVARVTRRGDRVVALAGASEFDADAVVLAAGAWISRLAGPHGVRLPVYGGRGYSFTAPCDTPLTHPLYFPTPRVTVAPQGGRARISSVMEFGAPDAPARWGRIPAIARSVAPYLSGVDYDALGDRWMGPRPLSADGLPLIGATATPGVFVAAGHGMWGVTLGPLTGLLLAELIVTGRPPAPLEALDPCR